MSGEEQKDLRPEFRPVIAIYNNPWAAKMESNEGPLTTGVVRMNLLTQAIHVAGQLQQLVDNGEAETGRRSYAWVMLDPTRRRGVLDLPRLVVASVLIGHNAKDYLPNALAKAAAHYRHGRPNGQILSENNLLLGPWDFGWGGSVEYKGCIAGGSGQSEDHDRLLGEGLLQGVVDSLHAERAKWLDGQRAAKGSHRWLNPEDSSAGYAFIVTLPTL